MNADWKLEKAEYAEFSAQTCDKIAVWPLCRERKPVRNSYDGPNYIRVLLTWFMQVCLGKPSHKNRQRWWTLDISVFLWLRKIRPRPAQGLFPIERTSYKNYKVYSQMNADWKLEKAEYAEFSAQTCDKIAVWPLCRERKPVRNSYDGPNYIRVLLTWFTQVCLGKPSHKNRQRWWTLDISVFLWLRKIRPRPAQGLFPIERTSYKNYKVYSQMNADWKVDKAQ